MDTFVMSINEALAELVVHGKFTLVELSVEVNRQAKKNGRQDVPVEVLVDHCKGLVICDVVQSSVSWHRINKNTVFTFMRPSAVRRKNAMLASENPSSFFF